MSTMFGEPGLQCNQQAVCLGAGRGQDRMRRMGRMKMRREGRGREWKRRMDGWKGGRQRSGHQVKSASVSANMIAIATATATASGSGASWFVWVVWWAYRVQVRYGGRRQCAVDGELQ